MSINTNDKELVAKVLAYKLQGMSNNQIAETLFEDRDKEYVIRRILKKIAAQNPQIYWNDMDEEDNNNEKKDDDISSMKEEAMNYHQQYLKSLEKSKQKLQDTNNSLRALKRKTYREDIELENIYKEFVEILDKSALQKMQENFSFENLNEERFSQYSPKTAVVQLSDIHFGEGVDYEGTNGMANMAITSAKLKKYAYSCIQRILQDNVEKVIFAFTGDMVNSDRRLDEVVSNVSSRTKSALEGINILRQFIQLFVDLLPESIEYTVASVVGNESRLNKEFGWTNFTATDNFDYIIHMVLTELFKDYENVTFVDIDDCFEQVLSIDGKFNLLLTHGNSKLQGKNVETEVQNLIGRYATTHGVRIHYVIFGHIHATEISDYYARSASIVGGNGYSTKNLNFISKSSQNFFLIDSATGEIQGSSIPLDSYDIKDKFQFVDEKTFDKSGKSLKTKEVYNSRIKMV